MVDFLDALFLVPAFFEALFGVLAGAVLAGEAEAPAGAAAFGFLMVLLFGALLAPLAPLVAFPDLFGAALAINDHQHLFQ